MSLFSDRRYDIFINDDPVFIDGGGSQQLRVTFQIEVASGGSFAFADIAIYNISKNTINKFFKPGAVIGLSAGYVGNQDIIFQGGIQNVMKEREGPSTLLRILATSGSTNRKLLNFTMPVGSTVPQTIRKIASLWGYGVDMVDDDFKSEPPYQRKSLQGDAYQTLNAMAVSHKFSSVIEQGKIAIVKDGKARAGARFDISEDNGMEGIPEISEIGCDVATRINPKIIIGSEITIDSKLKTYNYGNLNLQNIDKSLGDGIYKAMQLDHSGDSWGDAWTTKITGERLSA